MNHLKAMKTKPAILHSRSLLVALCAGMSVTTAFSQIPASAPTPYPKDEEPANYPIPDRPLDATLESSITPQRFVTETIWAGMKQVRLSEIAARRTMDSQVRILAQSIGADHSKANSELRAMARRKGYNAPAGDGLQVTNFIPRSNITSIRQDDRLIRNVTPDTTANDRVQRDAAKSNDRIQDVRDAGSPRLSGQSTNDFSDSAASQALVTEVRKLESAPDAEVDGMYLRMVMKEHATFVPVLESASRLTGKEDAEIQQFASATLLKLRDHEKQADKLNQSIKPASSDSINNPELRR